MCCCKCTCIFFFMILLLCMLLQMLSRGFVVFSSSPSAASKEGPGLVQKPQLFPSTCQKATDCLLNHCSGVSTYIVRFSGCTCVLYVCVCVHMCLRVCFAFVFVQLHRKLFTQASGAVWTLRLFLWRANHYWKKDCLVTVMMLDLLFCTFFLYLTRPLFKPGWSVETDD